MLVALGGCHQEASRGTVDTPTAGESEDEGRTEPTAAPGAAASARAEPMHLPFDDFAPTDAADPYTYHRTLSPGCTLAYQRWWGTPPDPGPPVAAPVKAPSAVPLYGLLVPASERIMS